MAPQTPPEPAPRVFSADVRIPIWALFRRATPAPLLDIFRWAITRELREVWRNQSRHSRRCRLGRRSPNHRIVIAREIEQTLPNEGVGLVSELANMPRSFSVKFVVHTALGSQILRKAAFSAFATTVFKGSNVYGT
jgi:hypothetical protein